MKSTNLSVSALIVNLEQELQELNSEVYRKFSVSKEENDSEIDRIPEIAADIELVKV